MAYQDTVQCPNCKQYVFINEIPSVGQGEKEDIYCPGDDCPHMLQQRRTNGHFSTHIVPKPKEE